MTDEWFNAFIRESNRIEGINRGPTQDEIDAHSTFFKLDRVSVFDLEMFVRACAGAPLRIRRGMDVRVGNHFPPPGGPHIADELGKLLATANTEHADPYLVHVEYETLHPFMDGNGRSGRALWAWMMLRSGNRMSGLGFLHAWYYQSLSESRKP